MCLHHFDSQAIQSTAGKVVPLASDARNVILASTEEQMTAAVTAALFEAQQSAPQDPVARLNKAGASAAARRSRSIQLLGKSASRSTKQSDVG